MKNIKFILMLLIAAVLVTAPVEKSFSQDRIVTEGKVVDVIKVSADTNANGITKTYIVSSLKDFKKITFFTGSSNNDSSSYVFLLYAGTGGLWHLLWNDTVTTLKALSGIVSNTDTSAARIFSLDMVDSTALFSELKWIRRNLATGNGTGPASNKTKMNDYVVGWKPE